MAEADIEYWTRQLATALDDMEPATRIEAERDAEHTIAVSLVNANHRRTRAEVISALEFRGFTVVSTSEESPIRIDATAEPLTHDSDVEPVGEKSITDGGVPKFDRVATGICESCGDEVAIRWLSGGECVGCRERREVVADGGSVVDRDPTAPAARIDAALKQLRLAKEALLDDSEAGKP